MSNTNLYENVFVYYKESIKELKHEILFNRKLYYFLNSIIIFSAFVTAAFSSIIFAYYFVKPTWYYFIIVIISAFSTFISSLINFTSVRKKLEWARQGWERMESEKIKFDSKLTKRYSSSKREFNFFMSLQVIMGSKAARKWR